MCTRVGKFQRRPWASVGGHFHPYLPLSAHSAVYTLPFPETRLTKHLNQETEESARRRTESNTQTHTPSSHIPSLFISLSSPPASGGCVLQSQGPKPGGAGGVGKALMCNATQTRSGQPTHHSPGGMLHTSHPEPPTASWEAATENKR